VKLQLLEQQDKAVIVLKQVREEPFKAAALAEVDMVLEQRQAALGEPVEAGGWFGGGGAITADGGGGSGHVHATRITEGNLIAGNQTMPSHVGSGNMTGNAGNGHARITFITSEIDMLQTLDTTEREEIEVEESDREELEVEEEVNVEIEDETKIELEVYDNQIQLESDNGYVGLNTLKILGTSSNREDIRRIENSYLLKQIRITS